MVIFLYKLFQIDLAVKDSKGGGQKVPFLSTVKFQKGMAQHS